MGRPINYRIKGQIVRRRHNERLLPNGERLSYVTVTVKSAQKERSLAKFRVKDGEYLKLGEYVYVRGRKRKERPALHIDLVGRVVVVQAPEVVWYGPVQPDTW